MSGSIYLFETALNVTAKVTMPVTASVKSAPRVPIAANAHPAAMALFKMRSNADDGNTDNADGCSNTCQPRAGSGM